MSTRQHRVGLAVAVGVVAAAVGGLAPLGAARAAAPQQPAGMSPLLANVYYRPLTVFSRGGRVTAVAGVPSDDHTYYMGSAGGVFKTTNAGETWVPITDGQIGVGSIGAIAVAPSNDSIVYVGTGTAEPRGNVQNGDGMYKSTDAGKTWTHIGLEKAGLIGGIKIHPQNPDLVYVAVVGNIFGPTRSAACIGRRTAARPGSRCSRSATDTGAGDITMDENTRRRLIASDVDRAAAAVDDRLRRQRRGRALSDDRRRRSLAEADAGPAERAARQDRRVDLARQSAARLTPSSKPTRTRAASTARTTAVRRGRAWTTTATSCSARSTTCTSSPIRWTRTLSTRPTRGLQVHRWRQDLRRRSGRRTATTTTCGSTRRTTRR